jgi:hypothetical protein
MGEQFDLWPDDAERAKEVKKAREEAEKDDWVPDDYDGHFPTKQKEAVPESQSDFFPEDAKKAGWKRKILERIKDLKEKEAIKKWWATSDKMERRLKDKK